MRTVLLLDLTALLLLPLAPAGEPPTDPRQIGLEAEMRHLEDVIRQLEQHLGPNHPQLLAAQRKLAALKQAGGAAAPPAQKFTKPILVMGKTRSVTLKGAEVRRLGDRYFLVGIDVGGKGPNFTKGDFAGSTVWLALEDVVQVVEIDAPIP